MEDEKKTGNQETKRNKFVSLAETRVEKALKSIRLIGNLSSKNNYSYDGDDVKQIIRALRDEVTEVEKRFFSVVGESPEFRLKRKD